MRDGAGETAGPGTGRTVPKVLGADEEFGNFILGAGGGESARQASRALLAHIRGAGRNGHASGATWEGAQAGAGAGQASDSAQDWGRKFLRNGGCAYVDLDHIELCIPEVRSAHEYVAARAAWAPVLREAMRDAEEALPQQVRVLANNSDGLGHSYGTHMNVLVTRRCYDNIFRNKLHYLLFFASHLTSSMVFAGAGKAGSENGRPHVDYQLSQRADFCERATGLHTTSDRPVVNCRDEPLCGPRFGSHGCAWLARVHVIFYDNTLCHVASLLKAGTTQIVLAMLEQDCHDPSLLLEDPAAAAVEWSHDPSLRRAVPLLSGAESTALDMQSRIADAAARFVAAGRAEDLVPRAGEIVERWQAVLADLRAGNIAVLARQLDWVLKRVLLERAMAAHPEAGWGTPACKRLDHEYHSVSADGLFWTCERQGLVERVVTPAQVERFVHEPPEDTRAWLRGQLVRRVPAEVFDGIDWDEMNFRFRRREGGFWRPYRYRTLPMSDPLAGGQAACEERLGGEDLETVLDALGAQEADTWGHPVGADTVAPQCLPAPVQPWGSGDVN